MRLPDLTDIDAWLAAREAKVPGLRPGCEKRIDWPGGARCRRRHAVVYVHGFSASPREISPVPERLADALDAPLHAARLTGHGRDGPAMAEATLDAWMDDVAEALAIGAALGERVVAVGCSTGCTLITLALLQGQTAAGAVMVSPNYRLASGLVQTALDLPGVGIWGPLIFGRERSFAPASAAHEAYWTTRYPTQALFPMADALRAVRRADLSAITVPALFAMNERDQVIDAREAHRVMARWGGPTDHFEVQLNGEGDPAGHLIVGDIFSPGQTGPMVARTLRWTHAQGIA